MLLVVASVAAGVLVVNATYPAILRGSNSIVNISQRLDQRIESNIAIVFATGELDESGTWQDGDGDGLFDVWVWVKNVGSARILGLEEMDVFFGRAGDFARIPYAGDAAGAYPQWEYTLENGTQWRPAVTLKVTIHYATALPSDTYLVRVVTPSGAYAEEYFSF